MEGRAWAAISVGANSRYSCWKDDLGVLKCKLLLSYLSYKGFFFGGGELMYIALVRITIGAQMTSEQ